MTINRTLAVIVTFNPTKSIQENISALHTQVDEILIVDNGTNLELLALIEDLSSNFKNVSIIYNKNNLGIASALNIGLNYGYKNKFKWCLTFDQDSKVTDGYVSNLIRIYNSFDSLDKLVVVGPTYVNQPDCFKSEGINNESNEILVIKSTMTSGNLINLNVLKRAKIMFKEDYFIDYVDHDFCLNLRKQGYQIIQANNVILFHNLGRITEHYFFGKKVLTTNHNYVRRYYITRNRWNVYKRYLFFDLQWVFRDSIAFFIEILKIILFEDKKLKKFRSIILGLWDSITDNYGEYSSRKRRIY